MVYKNTFCTDEFQYFCRVLSHHFVAVGRVQCVSVSPLVGRVDNEILSPNPLIIPGYKSSESGLY